MKTDKPALTEADRPQPQVRLSRRQQRWIAADIQRRRARITLWGGAIMVAVVVLTAGWLGYQRYVASSTAPGGLPGPRGGPNQAQDVNTLVGQPAPDFTVSDANGTSYAITPGRGRPLVLVSHMGIT